MRWNNHSNLEGAHAFLSPSNYHWLEDDEAKVARRYRSRLATARGTELHALAVECIKHRIKLANPGQTLSLYVNDAIMFRMMTEVTLMYSYNCFGTADAIVFQDKDPNDKILRIHDLKTGVSPASMKQLLIYAALFCLEYGHRPRELTTILRIYQNDDYEEYIASADEVVHIMDAIVTRDAIVEEVKAEEL